MNPMEVKQQEGPNWEAFWKLIAVGWLRSKGVLPPLEDQKADTQQTNS